MTIQVDPRGMVIRIFMAGLRPGQVGINLAGANWVRYSKGMKLAGGGKHRALLDGLEQRLAGHADLADLKVEVVELPTFDNEPEAKVKAIQMTPAAYRPSRKTILLNGRVFDALPPEEQEVVVAHEVGHALRDKLGTSTPGGDDCVEADLLCCKWGLSTALATSRRRTNGNEYADLLLSLSSCDEDTVRTKFKLWQMQKLAGVV